MEAHSTARSMKLSMADNRGKSKVSNDDMLDGTKSVGKEVTKVDAASKLE